jgi:hypothetical protein
LMPKRATLTGESTVYAKPITGMWKVCGEGEFISYEILLRGFELLFVSKYVMVAGCQFPVAGSIRC